MQKVYYTVALLAVRLMGLHYLHHAQNNHLVVIHKLISKCITTKINFSKKKNYRTFAIKLKVIQNYND